MWSLLLGLPSPPYTRRNAIIIETIGRKSGQRYRIPVGFLEDNGKLIVISEDGRRLETPQLRYDPGRNEISGDSAFVLTRPEDVVSGIGFVTDPDLTRIRCMRGCSGRTTKSVAQPER